jgi:V/A-type H+-transporting ATPase subunit D
MREVEPTRSAALELADELRLMRQGHEFLDEKRVLLATEMLLRLSLHQKLLETLTQAMANAARALAGAVERHGLDNLQVYPIPTAGPKQPPGTITSFLGVPVAAMPPPTEAAEPSSVFDPSPEAAAGRAAFARLLPLAAEIATSSANLRRLAREYRRTDRRARALENVLLPEVQDALKRVDEQLDAHDREESMHARWSVGAKSASARV